MKKIMYISIILYFCFLSSNAFAFNYTINFKGTGVSTTVDSVVVQNLTKGTSVTVPAENTLNLSDVTTSVEKISLENQSIQVCPNKIDGKFNLSFFVNKTGLIQINTFSIDGRKVSGLTTNLQEGNNLFQISLPKGVFVIKVNGMGLSYSAKLVCQSNADCKPGVLFIGTEKCISTNKQKNKNVSAITNMLYTIGDRLIFKGIYGHCSTLFVDSPRDSKTINFDFTECKDADGNYYPVITIGTQTWMVENLKTTKYRTGESIPNVTANSTWAKLTTAAWCDYNNVAANSLKYGKLYNWHAAVDSRNIAPVGWHVPTNAEWVILENYLISSGYNYDGSTYGDRVSNNKIAKSLAANVDWFLSTTTGCVGNYLKGNNSLGFSALPGGRRSYYPGDFSELGSNAYWWSSTSAAPTETAYSRGLYYDYSGTDWGYSTQRSGFSIRCVRDN